MGDPVEKMLAVSQFENGHELDASPKPSRNRMAWRLFLVLSALERWLPDRAYRHVKSVEMYECVVRAFHPALPPVTISQVLAIQSLKR